MEIDLPPEQRSIFVRAMSTLHDAEVPYLVAGALAVHHYTGIWRNTKDLDLFLCPEDRDRALLALADVGYRVEITASHWLAKAFVDDILVDLISGFGNWLQPVDETWFAASEATTCLGIETRVLSATDLIWCKAYVAGRERFDGADIAHVIRRAADRIDWRYLLDRFDGHWELLLMYLHYYRFVYPMARDLIPTRVLDELIDRLRANLCEPAEPEVPFRGPLLDRYSYLVDLNEWGETDPREDVARQRELPADEVIIQRAADRRRMAETNPEHGT